MTSSSRPGLSPMQSGRLTIFERHSSKYANYGFAISHFSNLEQGLLAVFICLDERSERDSIDAYWNIGSCRARFEWIEKRMKNRPPEDEVVLSWNSVRDRLDDAIELRNDLAHGEFTPIGISQDQEIVGYWARLAKTASTGQLSFNDETQMIEGSRFFSADQLIDKGLEFISISESLYEIAQNTTNR